MTFLFHLTDSSSDKPKAKLIYTKAVKQVLINKAPPIFTLHMKRFHQVGYSLKKIAKHVDFPFMLDLAPFCHKSGKVRMILVELYTIIIESNKLSSYFTSCSNIRSIRDDLRRTFYN